MGELDTPAMQKKFPHLHLTEQSISRQVRATWVAHAKKLRLRRRVSDAGRAEAQKEQAAHQARRRRHCKRLAKGWEIYVASGGEDISAERVERAKQAFNPKYMPELTLDQDHRDKVVLKDLPWWSEEFKAIHDAALESMECFAGQLRITQSLALSTMFTVAPSCTPAWAKQAVE